MHLLRDITLGRRMYKEIHLSAPIEEINALIIHIGNEKHGSRHIIQRHGLQLVEYGANVNFNFMRRKGRGAMHKKKLIKEEINTIEWIEQTINNAIKNNTYKLSGKNKNELDLQLKNGETLRIVLSSVLYKNGQIQCKDVITAYPKSKDGSHKTC
ncbi:hypothetical protein FO519_010082 [Halicephalobus sp. NKZ332]|nr:hypothetical protein FO519_010082 [Halicephalobus sp. NKZ332]